MSSMSSNSSVIAVYATHRQAETAIRTLQSSGFNMRQLSVIGKGVHAEEHPVGFYATGEEAKSWGAAGALWGGVWGLLFGAALVWVPGLGPLAVAGPLVNALAGALGGAVLVGGLSALGATLANLGLTREQAIRYETQLKADRYLLIAQGTAEEVAEAHRTIAGARPSDTEIVVSAASEKEAQHVVHKAQ